MAAYKLSSALITKIFPSAQDVQLLRWWLGRLRVVVLHTEQPAMHCKMLLLSLKYSCFLGHC